MPPRKSGPQHAKTAGGSMPQQRCVQVRWPKLAGAAVAWLLTIDVQQMCDPGTNGWCHARPSPGPAIGTAAASATRHPPTPSHAPTQRQSRDRAGHSRLWLRAVWVAWPGRPKLQPLARRGRLPRSASAKSASTARASSAVLVSADMARLARVANPSGRVCSRSSPGARRQGLGCVQPGCHAAK